MAAAKRWLISATILIFAVAVWVRLTEVKETPRIISGAAGALSSLFRGVLR